MAVMATGMHNRDFHTIPQRPLIRRKGKRVLFGDRKRIHVGAHSDDRTRSTVASQDGNKPGNGDVLSHLITETPQVSSDQRGGTILLIAQFRIGVKVASPG